MPQQQQRHTARRRKQGLGLLRRRRLRLGGRGRHHGYRRRRRAGGCAGRGCRHKGATSRFHGGGGGGDGFLLPRAKSHYAPDLRLVPTHLEIHLDLTGIAEKTLKGAVTLTFRCAQPATGPDPPLRKALLDAVAFSEVEVVSLDAAEPLAGYRYDGKQVQIVWANPFATPGEARRVRVLYTVQDPVAGMHFFGGTDTPAGEPVYALSDHETEKARYWLPCVDLPAVRTTAEFYLTTRAGHPAFANGVKISSAELPLEKKEDKATNTDGGWDGRRALTVWRLDFPCPSYLLCVAAGELLVAEDDSPEAGSLMPDVPIAYLAPRNVDPALLRHAFGPTPR